METTEVSPIEQALATYNEAVATAPDTRAEDKIAEWREQFSKLEIKDVKDTEGYRQVTEAIAVIRTSRVNVEKKRKLLKADALEFGRKVDSRAKELTAMLEPLEESLKAKRDVIDNEKERIKQEKEQAEQRRIDGRLKQLFDLGAQFNGVTYYIGNTMTTGTMVKEMKDDEFSALVKSFEAEAQRVIAEEKERARQEEIERENERLRLENERKEQERIAEERRIENERLQKELDEQRKEIERINQEAEQRRREAEEQIREQQRKESELREQERIRQEEIERQQHKLECELRDQRNRAREEFWTQAGFTEIEPSAIGKKYVYLDPISEEKGDLLALSDDDFYSTIARMQAEVKQRDIEEAKQAERFKSDKDVLNELAEKLNELRTGYSDRKMKTELGDDLLEEVLTTLETVIQKLQ